MGFFPGCGCVHLEVFFHSSLEIYVFRREEMSRYYTTAVSLFSLVCQRHLIKVDKINPGRFEKLRARVRALPRMLLVQKSEAFAILQALSEDA